MESSLPQELRRSLEIANVREENLTSSDHNTDSHDIEDHLVAPAGQHCSQESQLSKDLLEHQEKQAREQQIKGDEELGWLMSLEDLELEDWTELDHLDIRFQDMLEVPVEVPHIHQPKAELQPLGASSSQEQNKKLDNLVHNLFFAVSRDYEGSLGIGCIIKDASGQVVFKNGQCIGVNMSLHLAEYMALIYGLETAKSIGLTQMKAHGHRAFIYWEIRKQMEEVPREFVEHVDALRKQIEELNSFSMSCISWTDNEDAIKLADYAAEHDSHSLKLKLKSGLEEDITKEHCLICFENVFLCDMVGQKGCGHRFCFSCLSQHVEKAVCAKKVPVWCPQFVDCGTYMEDNQCQSLVCLQTFDKYQVCLTEATILDSEKVYCPFPECSAMMCRADVMDIAMYAPSSSSSTSRRTAQSSTECMECHRLFCVKCRVPWHADVTCRQYQALPKDEKNAGDLKVLKLAKDQKWRRCRNCGNLIILAEGCFHMTCRCGNEFCYTCGKNYKGKEKMCSCLLFSVPNIALRGQQERIPQANRPRANQQARKPWRT